MKRVLLVVVVVIFGCGGEPLVKYDALHDRSDIDVKVTDLRLFDRPDAKAELYLRIGGQGKHPSEWKSGLGIHVSGPRSLPDVLGDHPTLTLGNDSISGTYEGQTQYGPEDAKGRDDRSGFPIPIDRLAFFAGGAGHFMLNGKPFQLTPAELDKIRRAIVAAREATNAGK